MVKRGRAPKQVTWIICLVLYVLALLAHFGIIGIDRDLASLAWIAGFGTLLFAVRLPNL